MLDGLREHKGARQTSALFIKNVLVAWRNRWATLLRLLAPLLFLAMALIVQGVMNMNAAQTGRTSDVPTLHPTGIGNIPNCSDELFIHDKPCLDFIYTPKDDARVQEIVAAIRRHNSPSIPPDKVMGFSSRADADNFIQSRQKYVLGAVHFSESPSRQLQYIVQSNTSIPMFKGYVQSPNDFFQMPFISAIAREISRYYLSASGRHADAAVLEWRPQLAGFPHPQLSPGNAGYILPPFIFVACMFATISFLAAVVSEKESGLRQALQTMGLQQGSYWLSWWLFEAVMSAVTAWCLIGFGAILQLQMFLSNNVWLQFFLFWLFGMAMASFACCTSVFLENSQSAGNAGLAMILVGWVCQALVSIGMPYSPSIFYTSNGMGKAFFWIFALFPWNPLTKGVLDMSAAAENAIQRGLRFGDRHSYCKYVPDPARPLGGADMSWLFQDNNCVFSLEECFWVLLVQTVGWMLAAVYFDNVQPNKHGIRLPLWYPAMPSYWHKLFSKRLQAARQCSRSDSKKLPISNVHGSHGGVKHTPFAVPDTARKVAKAISEVKEVMQTGSNFASSPGGAAAADARETRGLGDPATQISTASTARHSVSSGMLRRRDNKHSVSGAHDQSTSSCRGSCSGDLATLPSRAGNSTLGRLPQFSTQHASNGSHQLVINPSVTALRLSEASGDVAHGAKFSSCVVGSTISLQQYQEMQAQLQQQQACKQPWWRFWQTGQDSLNLASKKHDVMVAAAAGGSQPKLGMLQQQTPDTLCSLTPVVLDAGVLQEEQRMKATLLTESKSTWTSKQDLIQVFGLRKEYKLAGRRTWWQFWKLLDRQQQQQSRKPKQYMAVVDSWFGVPKGQLMCLLGPNGAGKTTSINCLIGALPPSGGDVRVMGHSLLTADGLEVAQGVMGVCPQFDVLWDELTGLEHMRIYGCIKGLPSTEVAAKGAALLEQVQLTAAAEKRSAAYSGGMKRRLSVALALLGGPQLIFLDEPTTGMDPISRRAVWDAINVAKQDAAVVLTTHSMEEADALGDRIAIMVRGRMRVLGGSLTLKQKYGNGFQLRLRLLDGLSSASTDLHLPGPQQQQQQQLQDHSRWQQSPPLQNIGSIPKAFNPFSGCSSPQLPASPCSSRQSTELTLTRDKGAGISSSIAGNAASGVLQTSNTHTWGSSTSQRQQGRQTLEKLVGDHLGLVPTEQGEQMLHYVVPQTLGPELQVLLELLDSPSKQRQLCLAEVHVSLATLEEVFLTVVKQAEQDHAAMHGQTVIMELPDSGQPLELLVGQEVAVDTATGHVYAVDWMQDEWGRLSVGGIRQMSPAEQTRYWQSKHLAH